MIPKVIHYCWFGRGEKPELAQKCINSWNVFCSDYEIIEWNEDNIDLSQTPLYVRQAYEARKWAFVSDYVRLWVVYTYGGIYFDTDVEIIRPVDELLALKGFCGFETPKDVSTGLGFGAEKGNPLLRGVMDTYQSMTFVSEDGSMDLTPGPILNTQYLLTRGLKLNNRYQVIDGVSVFPKDYFCPQNYLTGKTKITKRTFSIHHYANSWNGNQQRYSNMFSAWFYTSETGNTIRHLPNRVIRGILGNDRYESLKHRIKER